jgi:hypothetical protein
MYSIEEFKNPNLYDMYFKILSNFNNQLKVRTDKSDSQKQNWISNDNIYEIGNDLKSKVVKKK